MMENNMEFIVDNKNKKSFIDASSEDECRLDALRKDGKLLLTDDQKKAVLAKGKILVSAAAGSGKTSTMVQRIMLMVSEGVSMRDMLILVYNTSAADELKERLHNELFDKACSARGELRERFRKELDDLPFCHICTIHAYCSTLIRENFDKLGLSPTFEVLDEQAHAIYKNAALDNVFDAYSQQNDEAFADIAEIFSQARREDNLRANVIKLHALIEIQPDKKSFDDKIDECFSSFEDSEYMSILQDYYKSFFDDAEPKLEENLMWLSDTSLEKYKTAIQCAIVLCKEIKTAKDFRRICAIASEYQKPDLGKRVKIQDFEKRISDVSKSYLDEIWTVAEELSDTLAEFGKYKEYHAQNGVYVRKIIEITRCFDEELQSLKQKDNVLSFEDLQKFAVQLLKEYPYLGDEFKAVFVDEYQDVNPTQEFIIKSLIRGECFMVGDVKQSIYGFRLADPSIFLSRQIEYKNGAGTAIDFNRNFRSARAILAFVNGVFNAVMTEKNADVDYKNTSAFELEGAPTDGFVQVHLFSDKRTERKTASGTYDITAHEKDEESVSASQYEGKFIANEIKTLVGHAVVGDRKMDYGDIAILFRSRSKGAGQIVEQLKNAGIPVDESIFGKSTSKPERELVCLLRVLDNPRQDIPLAGFLLSFFGGYNESELALVASLDGECLYDKVKAYSESDNALGTKLKETLAMLERYRIKASFKNVSELMNGIVSDFCYDAYLMKSGESDVYGLKAFIGSVPEKENASLGKFLDGYCESGDGKTPSAGGNRVHISTFHAYKGLEIPVVFVADTAYGFNYESGAGDLSVFGKGYVGLKAFDFKNKYKYNTLSKLAVAKMSKLQCVKEEMRLFYVALTRAKQMTYVTASVSAKKGAEFGQVRKIGGASCDLDFISTALCEESVDVPVFRHGTDEFPDTHVKYEHRTLSVDGRMVESIMKGRDFIYPHTAATKLAMKYSVSAIDKPDDQTVRVYEEGANVGTIYHRVMQYVDLFAEGENAVGLELERMVKENILTDEERSQVDPQVIARCLESDIIKQAKKALLAGKCLREQPFMMYKPANEVDAKFESSDKVLVQGVVDLYIDGEMKILVDFKYSRLDDEILAQKYKKQLYLYKTAIESAINAKIDRIVIYSFRTGSTLDVPFD